MRAIRTAGIFLLICALILAIVSSVSLLSLQSINITYTDFKGQTVIIDNSTVSQLRFGIWNNCYHILNGTDQCTNIGYAYSVQVLDADEPITIGSIHTRGLFLHLIAALTNAAALVFSPFPSAVFLLAASVLSGTSAFFYAISFFVDVALYTYTKQKLSGIGGSNTTVGIGTWLGLVAMALTGFASFILWMVRRRMIHPAKPPPKKDAEAGPGNVPTRVEIKIN